MSLSKKSYIQCLPPKKGTGHSQRVAEISPISLLELAVSLKAVSWSAKAPAGSKAHYMGKDSSESDEDDDCPSDNDNDGEDDEAEKTGEDNAAQ